MLSTAVRKSPNFLRALPIPVFHWTLSRTRPGLSNVRLISMSQGSIPALEDILKPRVKQKAEGTPTPTTTTTLTEITLPPSSDRTLFISGLPQWDVQQLEESLGTIFSAFGEISSIRVGVHANGRKHANLTYKSVNAAQQALRAVKETPVSIDKRTGQTLTVKLLGKGAETPIRVATLFFTGFHGNRDVLREALHSKGYKTFQMYFFLGSQSGGGRIDFPGTTDIRQAYDRLNGIELGEGATLKLLYKDEPTGKAHDKSNEKESDGRTMSNLQHEPGPTAPPPTNTYRVHGKLNTTKLHMGRTSDLSPQPMPTGPRPAAWPKPMKVLKVGNIPSQTPGAELEATVRQFFERHGSIASVDFATEEEGKSQRCCYVCYVHPHEAQRARKVAAEAPLVFENQRTTVALVPRAPSAINRILHFRGFGGLAGRLREAFGEHSQNIKRLKILYDARSRKPTGSGVIEFQSEESAARALEEVDGRNVEGRRLKLTFYKPTPGELKRHAPNRDPDVTLGPTSS